MQLSHNIIPAVVMTVPIILLILIFPTSGGTIDLVSGQHLYLHHMAWAQEYKNQIPNTIRPMGPSAIQQNLSNSTLFDFDAIQPLEIQQQLARLKSSGLKVDNITVATNNRFPYFLLSSLPLPVPPPQSVPFYRPYSSTQGNHFYTTNSTQRDNAIAKFGYKVQLQNLATKMRV